MITIVKTELHFFFFENKKQCFTIFRSILNSGISPHTEYNWSCTVHKEYKSLNYLFDNNKLFVLCDLHTAVKVHLWRTFSGFFARGSGHAEINTIPWKKFFRRSDMVEYSMTACPNLPSQSRGFGCKELFLDIYLWLTPVPSYPFIYLQAMSSTYSFHISSVQCAHSSQLIKHTLFFLIKTLMLITGRGDPQPLHSEIRKLPPASVFPAQGNV